MESERFKQLNGLCPYFTMFPMSFPLRVLSRAAPTDRVLDPFCGRGTTNCAARSLDLDSVGFDSSRVAAAIAAAKLVDTTPEKIERAARSILTSKIDVETPQGEFWDTAYDSVVLEQICRLRKALNNNARSPERVALRAIMLGALHGPIQKTVDSYLSNQCPRTYSPKPNYAVRYWRKHGLKAKRVDVLEILTRRASRYYSALGKTRGKIVCGDSRVKKMLTKNERPFQWVITSPPYFGMKTYIPDQWLRHWFVGGPSLVDYSENGQLQHQTAEIFVRDLKRVWVNAFAATTTDAKLVIRFGGITQRKEKPLDLLKSSLEGTGWRIATASRVAPVTRASRQATSFLRRDSSPVLEYDVWASKSLRS